MGQIPIQKYCQTMQTNEQLLSAIENYLAQTEFPAEPELLYAPIGYSLAGGGKRLRPMLLMLSNGTSLLFVFRNTFKFSSMLMLS